jgi:hypothetical protein
METGWEHYFHSADDAEENYPQIICLQPYPSWKFIDFYIQGYSHLKL